MLKKTEKSFDSLQAARTIAAILVLLYHASGTFALRLHYLLAGQIFNFGMAGVDIFFVLSGFIIYYTSANKPIKTA